MFLFLNITWYTYKFINNYKKYINVKIVTNKYGYGHYCTGNSYVCFLNDNKFVVSYNTIHSVGDHTIIFFFFVLQNEIIHVATVQGTIRLSNLP